MSQARKNARHACQGKCTHSSQKTKPADFNC